MECYIVTGGPDDDDPWDTNIPEYGGTYVVERIGISSNQFLNPLKTKKVNIGSLDNPKFANIRDDETDRRITDLLHELQDLIPTNFLDMKRIVWYLGIGRDEDIIKSWHKAFEAVTMSAESTV